MNSAMSGLTAGLYGLLVVYGLGWYLGKWTGNFSLLLFILSTITLLYWLAERFYFAKRRVLELAHAEQEIEQRRVRLAAQGITHLDTIKPEEREQRLAQPWWLDWTAGLFPVILAVFLLRSFVFEPFKIPSGSMIPTLVVGDLILVNKFHYGIRLPVLNRKVLANNEPKRGDVMVFRFPANPSQDYIKRVVGIPGDTVSYRNQALFVNGVEVGRRALEPYYDEDAQVYSSRFEEDLTGLKHQVLVDPSRLNLYRAPNPPFPGAENCVYSLDGMTCKVPAGHYFMLGDNRDSSLDSRYWGFVPDENIVGKAFFVWMNFGNLKRIGGFH